MGFNFLVKLSHLTLILIRSTGKKKQLGDNPPNRVQHGHWWITPEPDLGLGLGLTWTVSSGLSQTLTWAWQQTRVQLVALAHRGYPSLIFFFKLDPAQLLDWVRWALG